jgi:predicted GNAT family N-acyltransferase
MARRAPVNPRPLSLKGEGSADVEVRLGSWDQFGEQARRIRFEVFVAEQGVPAEMEIDSIDPACVHALAMRESGPALGTGRLLPDGHIGRMAVAPSARGQGIGSALLLHLMDAARRQGHREVELFSQVHAQGFYERFGFVAVGAPFDDAGIAHVTMRARL